MAIHWSGGRLITFLDKSDSSVPALVSQLINEISPQVSAEYQGLPPDIETTAEHADIYDFGISLSSALHSCKANGNQRFVPSLITTMLGAFIKNFWPASIVLDDPLVALPRHPVEGYDPLLRFSIYRRPRLVLFAHVEEPSGSDVVTSDDEEEEEESSDVDDAPSYSSSRRMTASEFCADVQKDGKGNSSTSKEINAGSGARNSVAPLSEVGELEDTEDDIYLQWSILTGAYADFYLMGVICVGTNDTVWGTMASMLYQRRSWGISQPVFSLFLDGESTVVSAIVSWLSDDTHPTDLPNVLATYLTRYDLSVPDQSLAFSCLLRRLNSHVTEMQTLFERVVQSWYLESAGPPLYSWRADTFSNSQFTESGRLWRNEDNIRNWARSCETERSGSSSSSMVEQGEEAQKEDGINLDRPVKQPTSSQAYSTNIHNHQDIGTMTDSGRRSLRSKVGNTPDNSPPPSVQPSKKNELGKGKKKAPNSKILPNSSALRKGEKMVSNPESVANSSAPSDSSSLNIPVIHTPDGSDGGNTPNSRRLSCSEFCRSDYTKDKSNGRVAKYLGQRNIFPMVHPIGTIDGMPIPGERVNKHVEDFKRFTDIPKSALLGMIKAKSTSQWGESLRREISGLANTLSSNELKFVTSQSVNESIMSNISDRFEALLYISIRARQQAEDVYRLTLPEAAVRRQWDILMMEATSNMKELNIDAAVEQTIRLPQNTNLEAVRAKGSLVNDTQISGNNTWRGLLLDVRNTAFMNERLGLEGERGKDLPITIYDSLVARHSEHYEMVKNIPKIRDMQSEEPQQARCDGMVSLSVQVLDAHSESASQRKCIEHLRKLALVDLAASEAPSDSQIGKVSDMTLAVENNDIMQSSRTQIPMIQGGEKEGWENVDEDEGNDELLPSESVDALHSLDSILAVEQENPVQPSLELEAKNEGGPAGRLRPRKKKEPEREIKAKAQAGRKKRIISGDLKLPLLVQEYKRFLSDDDKKGNAVNQARLDIAASLKFLAALGIYDFSVYTIATDGTRGTLCYGYMEQGEDGQPDIGYIYEHNTRTFDIANPVDVFNLAITFGHICVENGNVLRDKFNLVADGLKNDLKDAQAISKRFWTAAAQNISLKASFAL